MKDIQLAHAVSIKSRFENMPKKEASKKEEAKKDPFWLVIMVALILFTVLLLVDRNRFAILLSLGVVACFVLYRNPIGGK